MQDEADFKADRRAKMLQTLTVADDGCVVSKAAANLDAEKAIKTILIAAEDNTLSIEERMEFKQRMDSYFLATFVAQPKTQKSVVDTINKYVVPRDGWHWCLLCSKWTHGRPREELRSSCQIAGDGSTHGDEWSMLQ